VRAEVARIFAGVPASQRECADGDPYLSFIRICQPTDLSRGMLEPSICMVVQGAEKVLIRKTVNHYGSGSYVLSAIDLPVSGQIVEAMNDAPYYGVRIDLDPKEIAAFIIELTSPRRQNAARASAPMSKKSDASCRDFLAPDRLLKKRRTPAMSRILKQEIMYRLISAQNGDVLYHTVRVAFLRNAESTTPSSGSSRIIPPEPMSIEKRGEAGPHERVDPASSLQGDHGDGPLHTRSRRVCWKRAACSMAGGMEAARSLIKSL